MEKVTILPHLTVCAWENLESEALFTISSPPQKTSLLQEKTSALKREHPAFQNMIFLNFFLFLWVTFTLLDPDPDPQTWLNPDPIRIWIRYTASNDWKPATLCIRNSRNSYVTYVFLCAGWKHGQGGELYRLPVGGRLQPICPPRHRGIRHHALHRWPVRAKINSLQKSLGIPRYFASVRDP